MIHKATVDDLARALMRRRHGFPEDALTPAVFFIGAGCSKSARIPLSSEIAQSLIKRLRTTYLGKGDGDSLACLIDLLEADAFRLNDKDEIIGGRDPDWGVVYDEIFSSHYRSPDEIRPIFQNYVKNKKINYAHLALGEMAKQRWISTTVTTNFDLFVLEGYARAGVIPVVSDGVESLNRIDGKSEYHQLVQINGSIHAYRLRNNERDLNELKENQDANVFFRNIFGNGHPIVFIGYSGRERDFMDLLIRSFKTTHEKQVFWCLYSPDESGLSDYAREFLSHSSNSSIICNQDADSFFYELLTKLGVGFPSAISDPLKFAKESLDGIEPPALSQKVFEQSETRYRALSDISDAISSAKSLVRTIVSESSMGENTEIRDSEESVSASEIIDGLREARAEGDSAKQSVLIEKLNDDKAQPSNGNALIGIIDHKVKELLLSPRGNSNFSRLSRIDGIENFLSLNLAGSDINTLTFLRYLPELRSLNVGGSNISDLSPIKHCKKMESLFLGGTLIARIDDLAHVTKLNNLNLSGLKRIRSFNVLSRLSELKVLEVSGTNIDDLSDVPASVESLNLAGTAVQSVYRLGSLLSLKTLVLANTDVSDLGALSACKNLENINLWRTKVSDLSPLNDLPNLKKIYVRGAPVDGESIDKFGLLQF